MYNINRLKDMLVVMEDCVLKLENFNNVYKLKYTWKKDLEDI